MVSYSVWTSSSLDRRARRVPLTMTARTAIADILSILDVTENQDQFNDDPGLGKQTTLEI